jgi:hypothetical protein
MKYYVVLCLALLICSCSSNNDMDLQGLGTAEFSKENWGMASQEARGEMVYSLSKNYKFNEMNKDQVLALLGESTAYYEYDEFPAYFVGPKNIASDYGNGYLLAFPLDRETGLIREVVIIPPPDGI